MPFSTETLPEAGRRSKQLSYPRKSFKEKVREQTLLS
jgi:hypothetical protein